MSKYSKFKLNTPPNWQMRRLNVWLDEWALEMKLRRADAGTVSDLHQEFCRDSELTGLTAPFDSNVRVGQIRLLSPKAIPGCNRFFYFAVVADWADRIKLISPFGNFSEPASTGELLTERSDLALRVLCVWNSHTLPTELLNQSWLVDRMEEVELDAAWAVFEHVTFGKPLPDGLVERVGPPITHPRDPRRQYQEEETHLMAPLKKAAIEWSEDHGFPSNVVTLPGLAELAAQHELALAAAEVRGSLAEYVFWTSDKQTMIVFRMEGNGNTLSISVWNAAGEPSNGLDGCMLIGSQGEVLASIEEAIARVPVKAFLGDFKIKNSAGGDVVIVPQS